MRSDEGRIPGYEGRESVGKEEQCRTVEERREGLVTEGGRVTSESEKRRRKRRHKRTDKSWRGRRT